MDSAVTLETHPNAFPTVGQFEGEDIRARFVMRHVLYYFVDDMVGNQDSPPVCWLTANL